LSKIVLIKRINAMFLAIVLVVGTFALASPSFIVGAAQATPDHENDYDDKKSYVKDRDRDDKSRDSGKDNDEEDKSYSKDRDDDSRDYENDYDDKKSYEKDRDDKSRGHDKDYDDDNEKSYGKDRDDKSKKDSSNSVFVKKLKCNNVNVNLNGVDVDIGLLNGNGRIAEAQLEEGTDSFVSNGEKGQSNANTDYRILCINNNNNNRQGEPPTPSEELAKLNVIKNVECDSNGGSPNDAAVCDFVEANISPEDYEMTVTGNNPTPSQFPGSSTGTKVQLEEGDYIVDEVLASTAQLQIDLDTDNIITTTTVDDSSDCEGVFNQNDAFQEAIGTISAEESHTCAITNTITVTDGEVPSPEDFATLQIVKAIPCFTTGPGQEDVCSDIFAAITPNLFDITVSGNNPKPSNFEGTSTQTEVKIGPGNYQISETADSSVNTLISQLETNLGADISGPQSIFNGACAKQGNDFATGTIAEGETQSCTINNAFTVESVTGPPVDTQPPNVLSFTAEPFRVSFSSGGTITITAHVTDATGVQRVGVFIQDECGGSPGFFQTLELPLVTGTSTDGTYQRTFTFPESALGVNHFCNPNLAFQIGGLVTDTLDNSRGLPLIGVILEP
jgi:hypothetical protein